MSRRRPGGPARHLRGMPRARDLRDGVTGEPLENVRNPATTISQGYRGRDVLAGKAHTPDPRDLWAEHIDTWMDWNCVDCGERIRHGTAHHVHRQTGSHRCSDCQSLTYPE